MEYRGLLGVKRPFGLGPFVKQEQGLTREEFIRRCKESENSQRWTRNYVSSFVGDELADRLPEESSDQASEGYCKGVADFLGLE